MRSDLRTVYTKQTADRATTRAANINMRSSALTAGDARTPRGQTCCPSAMTGLLHALSRTPVAALARDLAGVDISD